ncbi:MAG TPA: hypothetical protein VGI22_19965 [Xanthobacteraceae bacterium]|jgi:hypothetical protein
MGKFQKGKAPLGRRWKKGQSGNPAGPPKIIFEIARVAKQYTWEALETLAGVMRDKDASPPARVAAAVALLDRAWGRPMQAVEVTVGANDVRNLSDVQLLDLINQQRTEPRDAREGTLPTPPDTTKLN